MARWLVDGKDTLGNIIWTDETSVQAVSSKIRQSEWTHESTPTKSMPVQNRWIGGKISVMFWGCISKHVVGPLLYITGSINGEKYIEVLKNLLLPELKVAREQYGDNFKLMHDNAPCHRSAIVKTFLNENQVEFIDWPPYSPDMSPIENLWSWMKRELTKKTPPPTTRDELIDYFSEIWLTITPEMCAAYCGDYHKRLIACKEANGMHKNMN